MILPPGSPYRRSIATLKGYPMKRWTMLLALAALGVTLLQNGRVSAQESQVVATATGGGIAAFTPPWSPDYPITYFGLSATIRADGTAKGVFECGIPALLTLTAKVTDGGVNGDGSVTVTGTF